MEKVNFDTIYCHLLHMSFLLIPFCAGLDMSFGTTCRLTNLECSVGIRRLKVTLRDQETRLSGVVGSKLRISG